MVRHRCLLILMIAALSVSCNGTQPDPESPFKMKIMFLDGSGPGMDFPQQVTRLRLKVTPYDILNSSCTCPAGGCVQEYAAGATGTVALDDFNNDGIYEEAVFENLPFDCPFSLEVFAYQNYSLWVNYYGRVDGLQLTEGKRLFVKMTLYQKAGQTLHLTESEETAAVFGHTATRLARGRTVDHRVFIAGGFNSIVPADCTLPPISSYFNAAGEECAVENPPASCFRCYIATATSDILLFEQGSGTLFRPQAYDAFGNPGATATLATPRAFHTATLLADGRVVLAGGVDRAAIIFQDNDLMDDSVVVDSGWELKTVVPLPDIAAGFNGALNSFEIFNPELNADTLDVDRDGDFKRGGMQILTGMELSMDTPRFLHAAAYGPWLYDEDLVKEMLSVQVGGLSGLGDTSFSEFTVDIFDGSLSSFVPVTRTNFSGSRAFPGAVKAVTSTWIFGGARFPGSDTRLVGMRNNAIGEKWDRNPSDRSWTGSPLGIVDDHPEYVRLFPDVIPVKPDGTKVILAGWYGSRCSVESDTETPTYVYETADEPPVPIPTHVCNSNAVTNNYIVDLAVSPPVFNPGPNPAGLARYALGSTLVLDCDEGARGGWILQSGGITDNQFTPAQAAAGGAMELYRRVDETYVLFEPMPATFTATLASPRMWHRAVELKGGSVLFIGGVTFDLANNSAAIVGATELLAFEGQCGDGYCHVDPLAPSYEGGGCCPFAIDGCL